MKVEKLHKNTYRVRKMINGQTLTLYFDHEPKQSEIFDALAEARDKAKCTEKGTLKDCALKYIKSKTNVLKSSTKRGYKIIINNLPDWLANKKVKDITKSDLQRYVNDMSKKLAAKTVRNRFFFIFAVISDLRPREDFRVTLPMVVKKQPYFPSTAEVTAITKAVEGTEYEIPLKLAVYGLRQSEIGALTIDDLKGNTLYIHKSLTQGEDNKWVLEESNKTSASTRTIEISDELSELIRKQGYIYKGSMHTIYDVLRRVCKDLDIHFISIHKFRHFFASFCHKKGVPEAVITNLGGWATPYVMKSVYRHVLEKDEAAKKVAADISSLF